MEQKIYQVKVRQNKATGQKLVTIPKEATDINEGDYIFIKLRPKLKW